MSDNDPHDEEAEAVVLSDDEPTTSGVHPHGPSDQDHVVSESVRKRQGKAYAIPWPTSGFCSLCPKQTRISQKAWSRHLRRVHSKELKEAEEQQVRGTGQQTLDQHLTKPQKSRRLFVLYAATSSFPVNHLNNKYLQAGTVVYTLLYGEF